MAGLDRKAAHPGDATTRHDMQCKTPDTQDTEDMQDTYDTRHTRHARHTRVLYHTRQTTQSSTAHATQEIAL